MKKIVSVLVCLLILCIVIGTSQLILKCTRVLADENSFTAELPLEYFGFNSTTPIGLSPAQISSAYNLPLNGSQGTIAIVDPYDEPTILNDTNVFSAQYGLPNLNSTNFEKHTIGSVSANVNWTGEISLDVEWAHAIAPNAKILLVETIAPNDSLFDGIDYARSRTDVVAISMSWGTAKEFSGETSYDSHFQPSGNSSCRFFASSGDHCENVSYPACSPDVVGVGGTILSFSEGSIANETVWYNGIVNGRPMGTGGGISLYETEPSYQQSYNVSGANGHRCVPDVSFDADPHSGYPYITALPTFTITQAGSRLVVRAWEHPAGQQSTRIA